MILIQTLPITGSEHMFKVLFWLYALLIGGYAVGCENLSNHGLAEREAQGQDNNAASASWNGVTLEVRTFVANNKKMFDIVLCNQGIEPVRFSPPIPQRRGSWPLTVTPGGVSVRLLDKDGKIVPGAPLPDGYLTNFQLISQATTTPVSIRALKKQSVKLKPGARVIYTYAVKSIWHGLESCIEIGGVDSCAAQIEVRVQLFLHNENKSLVVESAPF